MDSLHKETHEVLSMKFSSCLRQDQPVYPQGFKHVLRSGILLGLLKVGRVLS